MLHLLNHKSRTIQKRDRFIILFWSLIGLLVWKYWVAPSPLTACDSKPSNLKSSVSLRLPSTLATIHSILTFEFTSIETSPYHVKNSLTPFLAIIILWHSSYLLSLFLIILPVFWKSCGSWSIKLENDIYLNSSIYTSTNIKEYYNNLIVII